MYPGETSGAFQFPMVEMKRTEVAPGAFTVTVRVSPIFIAACTGLVSGVPAFNVVLAMPKVAAVGVTVKLFVAVAPSVVAVTVVAPAVLPLIELENSPLASVIPEAGVKLTTPAPA